MRAARLGMMAAVAAIILCLTACAAPPAATHVDTPQEWGSAYADCLRDKGWEVTIADDGSVTAKVPAAQGDAYDDATVECRAGLTITPFDEYTDAQRHDLYDAQVALRSCLVSLDIDLPEPPSYAVFEEAGGTWTPYLDVPQDVVSNNGAALSEQCPPGR
jgi:hypothetical protein